MKGVGGYRTVTFVLATIVGSKNKNINLRDFMDGILILLILLILNWRKLVWVKLQNGRFHMQISILVT